MSLSKLPWMETKKLKLLHAVASPVTFWTGTVSGSDSTEHVSRQISYQCNHENAN